MPLLRNNRAFVELNIVSYMGAPFHVGAPDISMGAICAVDRHEGRWSKDEVAIILLAT